ncbi:MAG: Hpt domain-containing protein [Acidobacteriota bacterium]
MTVFVVGPVQEVRAAICRTLQQIGGFVVVEASSAAEAADAATRLSPDALVLDMRIPHDHRLSALGVLRGCAVTAGLPLVLLADELTPGQLDDLRGLGVERVISGPLDGATLSGALFRTLPTPDPTIPDTPARAAGVDGPSDHTSEVEIDADAIRQLQGLAGEAGDDLVEELLALFATNTLDTLSRLKDLAAHGHAVEAARFAHSLAGSASTVGAIGIAAVARHIEDRARRDRLAEIPSAVDRIDRLLEPTLALLRATRGR